MIIKIINLTRRFGDIKAVDNISLDIEKGEVLVIIGPSGSGKSTFLRCLNALEDFDEGKIIINNMVVDKSRKNIHDLRLEVGMVFQQFNLFPHLTVLENISLAQKVVRKRNKKESAQRAHELLESVGLLDKTEAYPAELSGGQKQRVAIARALAMDPEVMLFDEITSALDPEMIGEVLEVMKALAAQGKTMLIVTHKMSFARDVADRIIFMEEGKIIEQGQPAQILDNPTRQRTRDFLKNI